MTPPKRMALAGKRLRATITCERGSLASLPWNEGETQEVEVEVTGTYYRGSPAKRDGGNVVSPEEDPRIELDEGLALYGRAERDRAEEALLFEYERQQERHESMAEDHADGEREERRLNHA